MLRACAVSRAEPSEQEQRAAARALYGVVVAIAIVALGLAAAWRWTALGAILDTDALVGWAHQVHGSTAEPFAVLAAFVVGGLVVFPLTALIVASGLAFGPLRGSLYSLAGALASAAAVYWIGRALGRQRIQRLGGSRIGKVSRALGSTGTLGVMALRLVPVAPYTLVNLTVGASHVGFPAYLGGTLLGLLPGIIALSIVGDRIQAVLEQPTPGQIALSALVVLAALVLATVIARLLWRRIRHVMSRDEPAE